MWAHLLQSVLHRAGKLKESVSDELLQRSTASITSAGLDRGSEPHTAPGQQPLSSEMHSYSEKTGACK